MLTEVIYRRGRTTKWLIWGLLTTNVALLAVPAFVCLNRMQALPPVIRKDAETMSRDVYCQRWPFAVFVDKQCPERKAFTFARYGVPLILSVGDPEDCLPDGTTPTEEVTLAIGEHFSIWCRYSAGPRPRVVEIMQVAVSPDNPDRMESLFDLNGDGFPDQHLIVDHKRHVHIQEIWYAGRWQNVRAEGRKYEKRLSDNQRVVFDRQAGRWVLAAEANEPGPKEGS